jgi:hypothetical protein
MRGVGPAPRIRYIKAAKDPFEKGREFEQEIAKNNG